MKTLYTDKLLKTFIEGVDCTGKTSKAQELHKLYGGQLILVSERKTIYMESYKEIFENSLKANKNSKTIARNLIYDRSPIIDIVLNGKNSTMLCLNFLARIFDNSQIILTTNLPFEKYQEYSKNKFLIGLPTDKYDVLNREEYEKFALEIERKTLLFVELIKKKGVKCCVFYL